MSKYDYTKSRLDQIDSRANIRRDAVVIGLVCIAYMIAMVLP